MYGDNNLLIILKGEIKVLHWEGGNLISLNKVTFWHLFKNDEEKLDPNNKSYLAPK